MIGATPTVILITDRRYALARILEVVDAAGRALDPGKLVVQLRDKAASPSVLASAARALRPVTERVGARLVVNAPRAEIVHVARDAGADGVHVPCRREAIAAARALFGGDAWISAPAHADDDVKVAVAAGATAALVSPIFETPGKGPARGDGALASARTLVGASALAIHALGGVTPPRAVACADAGADGVAVIRALLDADDPAAVARALDAAFRAAWLRGARGQRGAGGAPL